MEEELISKKELLKLTNISYGQLYRWKRKDIIPEEWFIKKSTFTGQETFFPKKKILERIELILSMKDGVSLDEIANMFTTKSSVSTSSNLDINTLLDKGVICSNTKMIFNGLYNNTNIVSNKELLTLNIIKLYMIKGTITIDELKIIDSVIHDNFEKLYKEDGRIILFRKLGIPFVLGCISSDNLVVDKDFIKILEIDLIKCVSDIKKLIM